MRSRTLAAGLTALLLAGGCAGVPSDGRVVEVAQVPADSAAGPGDERDIRVRRVPAGPPPDADPATIVEGFLEAHASFDGDHAIARGFLARDVRWDEGVEATVYDERALGPVAVRGGQAELELRLRRTGVVNVTTGEYRPLAPSWTSAAVRLVTVNEEWRISRPPPGLAIREGGLGRAFRRVTLYFPDPTRRRLVPQPLFLPQPADTPLAVVALRALLGGPPPALAPAVRTAIPAGTELLGAPEVDDGRITVNLSRELRRAATETIPVLAAQIVWTLTQPELGFDEVRLLVEGEALPTGGRGRNASRERFQRFAPEPVSGDDRVFLLRGGKLHVRDDPDRLTALHPATVLECVAVSRNGARVAGIARSKGRDVLVTGRVGDGPLRPTVSAPSLTEPTWQPGGDAVWTVAQGDGPPQVLVVPADGGPVLPVRLPAFPEPVAALELSPDGARAALVLGGGASRSVWVGYVQPQPDGAHPALVGLRRLSDDVSDVAALRWESSVSLVFVGRGNGRADMFRVSVDGFGLRRVARSGLPALPRRLAAPRAEGELPLLAEVGGRVWAQGRSGEWVVMTGGSDPTYAG